jgi:hypothetical protein
MANPQPEEFAEATTWRPDRGEHPTTVDGRLVRVSMVEGAYGRYPLLELQELDGLVWAIHAVHDVLRRELRDLAPQIGDRIQISYRGKTDRGYFAYRVRFVDGSSRQIDWSRLSDEPVSQEQLPITSESSNAVTGAAGDADDPSPGDTDDIPF